MKKINLINGIADNIEMNTKLPASNIEPFVVADNVHVFGGYTSNGDGTFTAPPPPAKTRADVNVERENRLNKPASIKVTGAVTFVDAGVETVVTKDAAFSVDMRNNKDRVNLGGLTQMGTLRLMNGDVTTTTDVYTSDDRTVKLTPPQLIEMGQQVGGHDAFYYAQAKKIKAMDPIPDDYATNETYWSAA